MARKLRYYVVLFSFISVFAKEPELPPCPTNFQFLPQTLPMHCKMTGQPQPFPAPGFVPPQVPAVLNSAKNPMPAPFASMPMGMGPPMSMGAPMPMGSPMPMGPMPMGAMPMPMPPMPMMGGPPQAKLPVIVMPFYSPDPAYKDPRKDPRKPEPYKRKIKFVKKPRYRHNSDSDDSDEDSSSTDDDSEDTDAKWNWKNRRAMRRRKKIKHVRKKEYLTPILQYVSKDGYVVFEKKISKGEANDWLGDNKGPLEVTDNKDEVQKPNKNYEKSEDQTKPKKVIHLVRDNTREPDDIEVNRNNQYRSRKQSQKSKQRQ